VLYDCLVGVAFEGWLMDKAIASTTQLDAPSTEAMRLGLKVASTSAVSCELGGPSKRETLVNYSG